MNREEAVPYMVVEIQEPDFGCEGRPEGYEPLDRVILKQDCGNMQVMQEKDAVLYEQNINVGDWVTFVHGKLEKCSYKNIKNKTFVQE